MIYTKEVQQMCCVAKGANHANAPIPEEGKWVHAKEIKDISGLTHGIGWCAPQQGCCKLTLNVKDGIIEEALVETLGCSGMTHSAAMASEILPGKTLLEALNTDLVCDAINTAMRELFLQIVYGRTQSAFSEGGLPVGGSLEDLGKNLRSQVGTMYGTKLKGSRYLEMTEGYCTRMALDADGQTALGESGLGAAVHDLEEELAHRRVDGVADEVGVESLQQGLAREDFRCHGGGVGHTRATEGLDEGFLDDAVLDIEGQFAASLLRGAPADTVGKAGDVLDFFCMHPLSFLRNRGVGVVGAFCNAAHLLHFFCVNHMNN